MLLLSLVGNTQYNLIFKVPLLSRGGFFKWDSSLLTLTTWPEEKLLNLSSMQLLFTWLNKQLERRSIRLSTAPLPRRPGKFLRMPCWRYALEAINKVILFIISLIVHNTFQYHAITVLLGNIIHVWYRNNQVPSSFYLTSSLCNRWSRFPDHGHWPVNNGIISLGEWFDGHTQTYIET